MQIEVAASWPMPGGGSRHYAVRWEESDLLELIRAKSLTRGQAIDVLSKQGEALVATYVHAQHGMGDGTYEARMQELRGGG
jgi:hypothetical protein